MSSDSFLDSSDLTPSKLKVIYKSSPSSSKQHNLVIYEDDTCKDIYIHLAQSLSNRVGSDMILAWYETKHKVYTLGFSYEGIESIDPFKIKLPQLIDSRFITEEGTRIALNLDTTDMSVIISELSIQTLYFTTWYDYLTHLNLPTNKTITDELCESKTNTTCQKLHGGFVRRFWPRLSQEDSFQIKTKNQSNQLKLETTLHKQSRQLCELIYSTKPSIQPLEYTIPLCILDTKLSESDYTTVYLLKLFSDIELGLFKEYHSSFSKLVLDDFNNTYSKLLKSSISYTGVEKDRYVSESVFLKWFKPQQTSIPNTPLSLLDDRNSIQFKLIDSDFNWITLIIYGTGNIKLVFTNESSQTFTKSMIQRNIRRANQFISFINDKQIYSEDKLPLFTSDMKQSFHFMTSSIVYPVRDYQPNVFETLLQNLTSFVRFNKSLDMVLSCVYKRTSHYDTIQSKLRVISLLHHSKRNLKREEIISELEKIFNISAEEALDEYEQWELLSNGGKIFQKGENGIECIFDVVGTNLKVDLAGTHSYEEFSRIQKFMDRIISIYNEFIETKQDKHKLFKRSKDTTLFEQVEQSLLADQLDTAIIQEQVPTESGAVGDIPRIESESDSESESESDSDVNRMGRLESDSDSESDSMGGGFVLQRGGYNVNRYYLERLKKFDKELFDGYSVKRTKHTKQGSVGYTYPRKCGSQYGRQPIAITKQDLQRIQADEIQKYGSAENALGKTYTEAVTVEGRDPNNYYICPKYWDVKHEKPLDPTEYESFKQHIVDNKMSSSEKKKTDKYILVRDETYWREAGDDISRYKIELWDDFHPKGYKVPCCRAPRKGHDEFSSPKKGPWTVEVFTKNKEGTHGWYEAKVDSYDKTNKKITVSFVADIGNKQTFSTDVVRRVRTSKSLTTAFPSNLGKYGHVNRIIKQLVQQPIEYPSDETVSKGEPFKNVGLVRKGVKRGTSSGDNSLLHSLVQILQKPSVESLIDDIMSDLHTYPHVISIGGGAFVNKFKFNFESLTELDANYCLDRMCSRRKQKPRHPEFLKLITREKAKYTSAVQLFNLCLTRKGGPETAKLMNDLRQHTAKHAFEKYLRGANEIILDMYVSPVLNSLSQMSYSATFRGFNVSQLSVITFEGTVDDVKLSIPFGGYPSTCESMILLYKERGFHYEPILYKLLDESYGIINLFILKQHLTKTKEQLTAISDSLQSIVSNIQTLIQTQQTTTVEEKAYCDVSELTRYLSRISVNCEEYIYDNYGKITMVYCDNHMFVPVRPSPVLPNYPKQKLKLYTQIKASSYPSLKDQYQFLQTLDTLFRKIGYQHISYCDGIGISVVNSDLIVSELILKSGHYIPVQTETYNRSNSIHKQLDIVSNISYRIVDSYTSIPTKFTDARQVYYDQLAYKQMISQLFNQKAYLYLKHQESLYQTILTIKQHPIKLRIHKSKELVELIDTVLRNKVVVLSQENYDEFDGSLDDSSRYEDGFKVKMYSIDDMSVDEVYRRCLHKFCQLLLIYSESDFTRFLQLNITLSKIKQSLQPGVVLFTYKDIQLKSYIELFQKYSEYANNYTLYGEGVSKTKQIQLERMKLVSGDLSHVEFTKQYPRIINQLCGRNLRCDRYTNDIYKQLKVVAKVLYDPSLGEENMYRLYSMITQREPDLTRGEAYESEVQSYKIEPNGLLAIANQIGRGFCLISQITTKLLQHDIYIILPHVYDESTLDILVLYQTETSLIHVIKDDLDMIPLSVLNKQKRFQQEYKRPYAQQVD